MTREEIERRMAAGELEPYQIKELWHALFLTLPEIEELLAHVRESTNLPWVYPMVCFAAHTGARRRELLRVQIADVDFTGKAVLIHERKRAPGKAYNAPGAAVGLPCRCAEGMAGRTPRRPLSVL